MKATFLPLWIGILLFQFLACKTKQQVVKSPVVVAPAKVENNNSMQLLLDKVTQSKFSMDAIKYSAEADYKDSKNAVTLNMEIVAKRGQYIWINAKAFGLVNVARIILKPDSVRIIDLVNKKYISASYNYLNRFIKAPVTFNEMQNLVFGNALFDPKLETTLVDTIQNRLQLTTKIDLLTQRILLNADLKAASVWLNEQGVSREMVIKYSDFESLGEKSIPADILINIEGEKKVACHFTLSNFVTDVKQDPSFVVPKSYKVEVFE
jgi:hypothetical protein